MRQPLERNEIEDVLQHLTVILSRLAVFVVILEVVILARQDGVDHNADEGGDGSGDNAGSDPAARPAAEAAEARPTDTELSTSADTEPAKH